jgi:hypothetical protein
MADIVRFIAIGGSVGALLAGVIVAPQVFAAVTDVPEKIVGATTITDLFPPPFDPSDLRKFDITFDSSVSKEVKSSTTIKKIGYGTPTTVSITTTASGTYSSDAIASPYVRYPGVAVSAHHDWRSALLASGDGKATWTAVTEGSFTYLILTIVTDARI